MDRDIASELVDVLKDIKTAVETIANGGETPAEPTTNVSDTRSVEETPVEPEETPVEPVTKKTSAKGGTKV